MNKSYTVEQLQHHGELILEFIKNPSIKIQFRHPLYSRGEWTDSHEPQSLRWQADWEYRIKPTALYINSLGEEFEVGDEVWYTIKSPRLHGCKNEILDNENYKGPSELYSEIAKTREGALELALLESYKTHI